MAVLLSQAALFSSFLFLLIRGIYLKTMIFHEDFSSTISLPKTYRNYILIFLVKFSKDSLLLFFRELYL